jgi:hypothetical protein
MDDSEGAVGRLRATCRKINEAMDDRKNKKEGLSTTDDPWLIWKLIWKLIVIMTDSILGLFPDAVLGVAGVACTAAGAIYLGQKWGWALNANNASAKSSSSSSRSSSTSSTVSATQKTIGGAQKTIASSTGSSSDPKKSDINWLLLYLMYAVGVVLFMTFLYFVFLLPDNERPDRLVRKIQMGGGKTASSIPYYALLIVGVSILGVLSSILTESTLRTSDPEDFQNVETEVPATNRRLLFLHGVAGLATAFAILLVIYPTAWVAKYDGNLLSAGTQQKRYQNTPRA